MKRLALFILFALVAVACGSPRTAIRLRNNADGTQTTIDIKQGDGGATNVEVVPTASVAVDTVRFATNRVAGR